MQDWRLSCGRSAYLCIKHFNKGLPLKYKIVLLMKVGNFRQLYLINCDNILNFVTLKMRYQTLTRQPAIFVEKNVNFVLV